MEIVQGQASAISIVRVFHPEAKVTHEAAIGSVDKKALEALMARGLSPEQAVEMMVSGILPCAKTPAASLVSPHYS